MKKPILCLDFDGVLNSYTSGWKGADVIPDPPVPGAIEFIIQALDKFEVHVFSSRTNQPGGLQAMKKWMEAALWDHFEEGDGLSPQQQAVLASYRDEIRWPTEKPPAMVTLDDRAITFTGEWPAIETLLAFKPWNKV